MMRLVLTSYRLPNPKALLDLLPEQQPTIAVIPNAKDYYAPRARNFKIKESCQYLEGLGLTPIVIDLADYSDGGTLLQKLRGFDALWVSGGNTFCLRYQMKRSGFDAIITELLETNIVYVGESAGACVLAPTLRGIESADQPEYAESIIWEGLGTLDSLILPHTDNPWMQEDIAYYRQLHLGKPILELTDSQTYVYQDGKGQLVDAD